MDNPFGSCNHIEFVRLIVALTRQYGVQMIAYTSTEDLEIRRLYPINILIRKGGAAGIVKRTGHTLVQQDKTIYNDGETTSLEINSVANLVGFESQVKLCLNDYSVFPVAL
jgi:hypothetical protein